MDRTSFNNMTPLNLIQPQIFLMDPVITIDINRTCTFRLNQTLSISVTIVLRIVLKTQVCKRVIGNTKHYAYNCTCNNNSLVLLLVSPHEVFTALRTPGMIRIGNHIIYHLIFN